ncbi:helix-turn-helix domain-containing protein [Actinoplanes sp. HUAS TT8]|uniref:helix-turn-helix domain-containing protein n=1 Tax=Actinoplanes sp. HUAS TT8 TaxID=3447453 RepID=UPI003F525DCC
MGSSPQARAEMRRQIHGFLSVRRARLTPRQAGLPAGTGHRRVTGLRREEVAALAGISVQYYIRLERGDATGVSETVLGSVSQALQLTAAEHEHLVELARTGDGTRPCRPALAGTGLRAPVRRILDAMTGIPAVVVDGRLDLVGANALGRALYEPMFAGGCAGANLARFLFGDPAARTFWRDWETVADDTVSRLRAEAGRNPCDHRLAGLARELAATSADFRDRWARHDVRVTASGVRRIHHPVVGELELPFETTPLAADPGQTLLMVTAEPGSPSEDALTMLAGWTATARTS